MNDEVRYQIYDYIKKYFYYIEYPDGVGEGFWKDADGKHHSIMFMTIEHLQECIKRIDKDIHRFEGALLDEIQEQALAAILLLANQIRNDLEEELEYQKNEEKDRQERDLLERRKRFEREETEELEYDGELSWEEPEQDAPDPLKTESVTMELPKWMIDKLKAEGEIGAVVERCVKKVGFKYEQKNEKPENEKPENEKPENVKPERRGVKEAVTEEAIKQVLKTSINSVQGFVQLALSYNWPKETMVRYLKLIEKTSQRMKKEIGKLQEK